MCSVDRFMFQNMDEDDEWALQAISGLPFSLTWDAATGGQGVADVQGNTEKRSGPRGGKKPLRTWQKQLNALRAELEHKRLEHQRAHEEGEKLRRRLKVLEVILPLREQKLQLMTQLRTTGSMQAAPADLLHREAPSQIAELHATTSSDSSYRSDHSTPSSADDVVAGRDKHSVGVAHHPYPERLQLKSTAFNPCSMANYARHSSAFVSVGPNNYAPSHVVRQFIAVWKDWVHETGLVLHAHDARPHDPRPRMQLATLWDRLRYVCANRLEYSGLRCQLLHVNVQTGQEEQPPPESFWVPVVQAMRLTPEQVQDCRAMLELYRDRVERLMAERRGLKEQLATLNARLTQSRQTGGGRLHGHGSQAGPLGPWGHAADLGQQQPQYLGQQQPQCLGQYAVQASGLVPTRLVVELEELTVQLNRNLEAEGHVMDLVEEFMGHAFFLVQMVRVIVLSYPYFPDAVAILHIAAASGGAGPLPA